MKDSRAEAVRWLRQANNDLEFARIAEREGFYHQACFISQQAAEKAVKAVLYSHGERIVLGHSLVELVDRLGERVPDFDARREAAGLLDQYYVATRYPNGLPGGVPFEAFGGSQAREAIDQAEAFLTLAAQSMPATAGERLEVEGAPGEESPG